MNRIEKSVKITNQMYEMRDLLRRIDGMQYLRKLRGWMDLVREVAEAQEVNELAAVLVMVKSLKERNEFTDAAFLRLTVAAVELIEPSPAPAPGSVPGSVPEIAARKVSEVFRGPELSPGAESAAVEAVSDFGF